MTFKIGDFIVYKEEKIKKSVKEIEELSLIGEYYNSLKENIRRLGNNVYIFEEYSKDNEIFSAKLDGKILIELSVKDFRLAKLEEKRKYQLKRVFKT